MTGTLSVYLERDFHAEELAADPDRSVTVLADPPEELAPEDLRGADVFVSTRAQITERTLAGLDGLKLIVRLGAGYDNVDVEAGTERGIAVAHVPQAPTEGIAQAAVGLVISCANNIHAYDRRFRERGWAARGEYTGRRLRRSTVGVVGAGRIGGRVVEMLEPFGPAVVVYDPYAPDERLAELGAERVELDELLGASDFVTVHVPLTEETRGLLGAESFRRMKPTAYLINTSRGGVYPDAELAEAIREGWIAGAAVDVFEDEYDASSNPLLELDDEESRHCLFTPHSISRTYENAEIALEVVLDAIASVEAGGIPPNVLNPEVYDRAVPESRRSPSFRPSG